MQLCSPDPTYRTRTDKTTSFPAQTNCKKQNPVQSNTIISKKEERVNQQILENYILCMFTSDNISFFSPCKFTLRVEAARSASLTVVSPESQSAVNLYARDIKPSIAVCGGVAHFPPGPSIDSSAAAGRADRGQPKLTKVFGRSADLGGGWWRVSRLRRRSAGTRFGSGDHQAGPTDSSQNNYQPGQLCKRFSILSSLLGL